MNAIQELKDNYISAKRRYESMSIIPSTFDSSLDLERMIEFKNSYDAMNTAKHELEIGLSRV